MGINQTWFTGQVDGNFVCSLCLQIFLFPVQTQCQHIFCRRCIHNWLSKTESCPKDGKKVTPKDLIAVPMVFNSLYGKLVMNCDFRGYGCEVSLSMDRMGNHRRQCRFNPAAIVACTRNCGAAFSQKERKKHCCVTYLMDILSKISDAEKETEKRLNHLEEVLSETEKLFDEKMKSLPSSSRTTLNSLSQATTTSTHPSAPLLASSGHDVNAKRVFFGSYRCFVRAVSINKVGLKLKGVSAIDSKDNSKYRIKISFEAINCVRLSFETRRDYIFCKLLNVAAEYITRSLNLNQIDECHFDPSSREGNEKYLVIEMRISDETKLFLYKRLCEKGVTIRGVGDVKVRSLLGNDANQETGKRKRKRDPELVEVSPRRRPVDTST